MITTFASRNININLVKTKISDKLLHLRMDGESLHNLYNRYYHDTAILGNESAINEIDRWFIAIKNKKKHHSDMVDPAAPILLISGPSGVGKSHIISYMILKYNFMKRDSYADTIRNANYINSLLNVPIHRETSVVDADFVMHPPQPVMLVFDDIDHDPYFSISTITDYLKKKKLRKTQKYIIPIVMICNNPYDSKLSCIFPKYVQHIPFKRLHNTYLNVLYDRISCANFQKYYSRCSNKQRNRCADSNEFSYVAHKINSIIYESNGDARNFINQLALLNKDILTPHHPPVGKQFDHSKTSPLHSHNVIGSRDPSNKDLSQRIESVYNLWEIYDMSINNDITIESLLHITNMESNWIVNGIWENYLYFSDSDSNTSPVTTIQTHRVATTTSQNQQSKKTIAKSNTSNTGNRYSQTSQYIDIGLISEMSDHFSIANSKFENIKNIYIDFNQLHKYIQLISILPVRDYVRKCKMSINASKLRFPSYFGKISNNRIIYSSQCDLIRKIPIPKNCYYAPYYFYEIVVKDIIQLLSQISVSDEILNHNRTQIFERLNIHNLTIDDIFILMRPYVFNMEDCRKKLNTKTKNLIKNTFY